MSLVRKIYVVTINSSEWLTATAHPSCLWQEHTLLGAWAAQCDSQVTHSCCLHSSRFRGAGSGSPLHTQSTALLPLTHCLFVSTQHLCTQGAALQAGPASRVQYLTQAGQSLVSGSERTQGKLPTAHPWLCSLFSLRLGKLRLILVVNERHRVMPSLIQQLHFTQELPGWGGLSSLGLYKNHFKQEV